MAPGQGDPAWSLEEQRLHINCLELLAATLVVHSRDYQLCSGCKSRSQMDRTDWMLHPKLFAQFNKEWGPLEVDLFATCLSNQLPRFFSWRPDPLAEATDTFSQEWSHLKGYANPPWCLVGRVLNHAKNQQAQVILVAPVWKGQPWNPALLEAHLIK